MGSVPSALSKRCHPLKASHERWIREDTSRIILAAGIDDLWLDLSIDRAEAFVQSRTSILERE